ncbi:universal stress protein [Povalibacter sp.]|uniref:universal stress protein n=1 Tax=Povalibacter sp. TaxID=1962978 RepID=UPI002F40DF47
MSRIHNILVIVDPTATEHPALSKAALLASRMNARVELFVCDTRAAREARLAARMRDPGGAIIADVRELLQRLAQPLRDQGIDADVEVDVGDPLAERLIEKIRSSNADLVVKDTHHHSLARRTFLTNTDWRLIRACPVPLLLAKPAPWGQKPRIVAAIDPGHANDKPALLDQQILELSQGLAQQLGGELHALHATIPMAIIAAAVGKEPVGALAVSPEDLGREHAEKTHAVEQLTARFGIDPDRTHVRTGGPAQLLPQAARDLHADILVMGALSRHGLRRAFLGSTAEDVLEHLPCDALIVKPPDFTEALQALCP